MGLFKSKYERELDIIIDKIEMNMSNNYKDNAQADLKTFEEKLKSFEEQNLLKDKARSHYRSLLDTYQMTLKGYSHKDQKPYWT